MEERSKKAKSMAGALVYLVDELGDARLFANKLKHYLDDAIKIIEASPNKEHIFEVAGHLLTEVPETFSKMEGALQAAALAASRLDYETIKESLMPNKAEDLEEALEDVRLRRPRMEEALNRKTVANELNRIASIVRETKELPVQDIARLISALETGGMPKQAHSKTAMMSYAERTLRHFADVTANAKETPSRRNLAAALREVLANVIGDDIIQADAGSEFQKVNPAISDEEAEKINQMHEEHKDNFK